MACRLPLTPPSGKQCTRSACAALKSAHTFVVDETCCAAVALADMYCPEIRDPTLLMKIGSGCSARGGSDAKAREYFVFIMDSLRVARLTGDIAKDEKLSVSRFAGRDKRTPGMFQALSKKKELVEFVFHEAPIIGGGLAADLAAFKTPLRIVQKFATSGADGLAAS